MQFRTIYSIEFECMFTDCFALRVLLVGFIFYFLIRFSVKLVLNNIVSRAAVNFVQ